MAGTDVVITRARGTVAAFDDEGGWGTVRAEDGVEYFLHCTAIADGSRSIPEGATVRFAVVAGRLGRLEAAEVAIDR